MKSNHIKASGSVWGVCVCVWSIYIMVLRKHMSEKGGL